MFKRLGRLRVESGSIWDSYTNRFIDNMSIIVSKDSSMVKYGEKDFIEDCYKVMTEDYKKVGLDYMADNLIVMDFDRYEGVLTMDEVCTFVNYMIEVSANADKILNMLSMSENELKLEIQNLKEIGF